MTVVEEGACPLIKSSTTRVTEEGFIAEFGGALFHREHTNMRLSRLGQKVKPFLEQTDSHVEGARRKADDFVRQQGQSGAKSRSSSRPP